MTRGFHISELWCTDGATYRAEDGYKIRSTEDAYEVYFLTVYEAAPLLPTEQTSASQVSVCMVIPREDVAGVVMGAVK